LFVFIFVTGSHYVTQAGLDTPVQGL
jgi:hypothetical protein